MGKDGKTDCNLEWHEQDEPGLDWFDFDSRRDGPQWAWLDEPDNVVRLSS